MNWPAALTAEAAALFKQTLFLEAEEEFLNALEADPNHIPALTGISTLYRYSPERWQEALRYAELAYSLAPEIASVLAHLTWALQSAYRYEDADRAAAAAMTANPESALAQMAQANVASSLYEYELALSHIKKALHDWPAAKEAAVKAIELEPDFHL